MRRLALIVLAGVLAAPSFHGAAARANPADCADPCTIEVVGFQYVAPVASIASGTEVRWVTETESHPTADNYDPDVQCFLASIGAGVGPVPVRFDAGGGAVTATTMPGTSEQVTKTCGSAAQVSPGTFALHFGCVLHPYMHGALLIHE